MYAMREAAQYALEAAYHCIVRVGSCPTLHSMDSS